MTPIPVLTIAGSDPSGGAGIQADLKTMSALGVYGMSVITAITAQNTTGVRRFMSLEPSLVTDQLEMVINDIPPLAIKTGMLASAPIVDAICDILISHPHIPLVVDPVMVATSGDQLIDDDAIDTIARRLFPLAALITPNVNEAQRLTGSDDPIEQAKILLNSGPQAVLLKGGDRCGKESADLLWIKGETTPTRLATTRINTINTHGTGCTLSSAIASYLAMGNDIAHSVKLGKEYIFKAIEAAAKWHIGHGHGPVNHYINSDINPNTTFR